jgi:hypothetical protein
MGTYYEAIYIGNKYSDYHFTDEKTEAQRPLLSKFLQGL